MDEFLGGICILTPNGIQCMSSPIKTHNGYGTDCTDGPAPDDAETRKAYQDLAPAILGLMPLDRQAMAKALMITKVVLLMTHANVFDPTQTFALVKRANTEPFDVQQNWHRLVDQSKR